MKYFQLQEDERITQRPHVVNVHEKIDVRNICKDKSFLLPRREIVLVRGKNKTIFTDMISEPFFLVSEKMKEVIRMYEPKMEMKELVLLDREYAAAETYYLPILEEVECLGKGTEYNPAHTVLQKVELEWNKIKDKTIFRIAGVASQYIIVNLDIVESFLKRDCLGIKLTEVTILH